MGNSCMDTRKEYSGGRRVESALSVPADGGHDHTACDLNYEPGDRGFHLPVLPGGRFRCSDLAADVAVGAGGQARPDLPVAANLVAERTAAAGRSVGDPERWSYV